MTNSDPIPDHHSPHFYGATQALGVKGGPPHLGVGAQAHYTIATEQPGNLVRMVMGGFFYQDDVDDFERMLDAALETLTCPPNQHVALCDMRAMKIQTQETVAAFARMAEEPRLRSRRLAFVTGASLARMQVRRLTDRAGVGYFTEVDPARAWLRRAGD